LSEFRTRRGRVERGGVGRETTSGVATLSVVVKVVAVVDAAWDVADDPHPAITGPARAETMS
jgi:hypothetical protein